MLGGKSADRRWRAPYLPSDGECPVLTIPPELAGPCTAAPIDDAAVNASEHDSSGESDDDPVADE